MPRPGPRPYECVKRAWHSDRHHPMRGLIIQRIFRVAAEAHSPETRKNREWQTKFPNVVMKAEEILYSKANSEAEYTDPDTLWERLNDAINTIIRRDESTETGQYIQPCIEAALVLGCVPVRESRSQQLKNPRKYLNQKPEEPEQEAQPVADKANNNRPPPRPPYHLTNQLTNNSTKANQASTSSPFSTQMAPNTSKITAHSGPHLQPNFPQSMPSMAIEPSNSLNFGSNTSKIATHSGSHLQPNSPQSMPSAAIEPSTSLNFGSVYPLHYGNHFQNAESQIGLQPPQNSTSKNILIGRPVGWPARQPAYIPSTMNLLGGESSEIRTGKVRQVKPIDRYGKAAENDCDLSLRLGPFNPCPITEEAFAHVRQDSSSISEQERNEHLAKNPEICFFPGSSASDPLQSCNNKMEQKSEFLDKSEASRKRKAPDHHDLDNGSIQRLQPGQFDGNYRWPGF